LALGVFYFTAKPKSPKGLLNIKEKKKKHEVKLVDKIKLTHDTYKFIFALPNSESVLGLKVGEHLKIHQIINTPDSPNGEEIVRSYTPVSSVNKKGIFELVIKVYRANQHPKFPHGGILS
jgi:cytochrome-b5 reductase